MTSYVFHVMFTGPLVGVIIGDLIAARVLKKEFALGFTKNLFTLLTGNAVMLAFQTLFSFLKPDTAISLVLLIFISSFLGNTLGFIFALRRLHKNTRAVSDSENVKYGILCTVIITIPAVMGSITAFLILEKPFFHID